MISSYSQKRFCMWAGFLSLLVIMTSAALGATVPYYQDFASGQTGISGGAYETIGGVSNMADTAALSITEGAATLTVGTSTDNVFVHLYAKPDPWNEAPAGVTNQATAVYVSEDPVGGFFVFSGDSWTQIATVPTDEYLGIAMHLDYAASTFDVYLNTNNAYQTAMKKVNAAPLPFCNNWTIALPSSFTTLTMTNSASEKAYVDAVAVSPSLAVCDSTYADLTIFLRKLGTRNTTIPPDIYGSEHRIIPDANAQTPLGQDLALGLIDGDELHVPDGTGYKAYTLGSGLWTLDNTANPFIEAGEGMLLVRDGSSATLALYPYADADVPGASDLIVMNPSASDNWKGYTGAAIPASYPGCVDINDAIFKQAAFSATLTRGDRLYFIRDEFNQNGRHFIWNGSAWAYDGSANVKLLVCPGEEFVFLNRGGAQIWTVVK